MPNARPLDYATEKSYNLISKAYRRNFTLPSARSRIQETVFSTPIIDTHEHVRPYDAWEQPVTGIELFNSSGCLRQYWVSTGTLSRQEYRAHKKFLTWPELSAALDTIKTTVFYSILMRGLKSLYNLDFDDLDEASFDLLSKKIEKSYQDPEWYNIVLKEKAKLEVLCQDGRTFDLDRSLFAPVARLDQYVQFARPGWRERVTAVHGEDAVRDLRGLMNCLEKDFETAARQGAVAVKSNETWCRRICYDDISEAVAEDALALCNSDESDENCVRQLGDYAMNRICELCAKHGLPLQLHTGPAMGLDHFIEYGSPLNLNSLFIRHPETKFVIFHAGGPFHAECRALAMQFPNVYLDLCGVLGVHTLQMVLDDWVEHVPHHKLMWGNDVNMAEEAYAVTLNFRSVLTDFLVDRVESGYMTVSAAEDFARAILRENAKRVLRW